MPAKENCCATQWNWQSEGLEAGQDQSEPRGIFEGKAARHPVLFWVIEIESTLQACYLGGPVGKAINDLEELIWFRHIFGIINPDDAATTKIECVIHRAWFGFKAALRNLVNPYPVGQNCLAQCGLGHFIAGFGDQAHIKLFTGIIEAAKLSDQLSGDVALIQKGNKN